MNPLRIPLLSEVDNRDSDTAKDSLPENVFFETDMVGEDNLVKRPGLNVKVSALGASNSMFLYGDDIYTWTNPVYNLEALRATSNGEYLDLHFEAYRNSDIFNIEERTRNFTYDSIDGTVIDYRDLVDEGFRYNSSPPPALPLIKIRFNGKDVEDLVCSEYNEEIPSPYTGLSFTHNPINTIVHVDSSGNFWRVKQGNLVLNDFIGNPDNVREGIIQKSSDGIVWEDINTFPTTHIPERATDMSGIDNVSITPDYYGYVAIIAKDRTDFDVRQVLITKDDGATWEAVPFIANNDVFSPLDKNSYTFNGNFLRVVPPQLGTAGIRVASSGDTSWNTSNITVGSIDSPIDVSSGLGLVNAASPSYNSLSEGVGTHPFFVSTSNTVILYNGRIPQEVFYKTRPLSDYIGAHAKVNYQFLKSNDGENWEQVEYPFKKGFVDISDRDNPQVTDRTVVDATYYTIIKTIGNKFYAYHYTAQDRVSVYESTDGENWTNLGSPNFDGYDFSGQLTTITSHKNKIVGIGAVKKTVLDVEYHNPYVFWTENGVDFFSVKLEPENFTPNPERFAV